MAQQITKKTRHVQKHDIEANWEKATGFAPMEGEIIVYTPDDTHDFPRIKIGHNNTNVNALPFINEPLIVEFDGQSQISHTSQEIDAYVRAGKQVYVYSPALGNTVFTLISSNPNVVFFTSAIADDLNVQRLEVYNDQAYYYDNYLATGDQFNDWLSTKHVEIIPDNLDNSNGVVLLSEDPVEQYDDDNNSPVEVLTFYGSGGDEPVRLRHLAPGVNDDDAATVGQIVQSDWDIVDESDPAAIKNKPFGSIYKTILQVTLTFSEPVEGANVLLGYFNPEPFVQGQSYSMYLDNNLIFSGLWPFSYEDTLYSFSDNQIVIKNKSEIEIHEISIAGVEMKKIDYDYLDLKLVTSFPPSSGQENYPVTALAAYTAIFDLGSTLGTISNTMDNRVLTSIGPIPTDEDESKFLQIVNGTPTWVSIINGNEVAY